MALEIIHGYTENDGGTLTQVTMFGEDSNVIRSYPENSAAWLLGTWNQTHSAGSFEIRAPMMHDNVNGIQGLGLSAEVLRYMFLMKMQYMQRQMNTIIQLEGNSAAAEYSVIALLLYYENLPSSEGRYITFDQLKGSVRQIMTLTHSLTPASTTDYTAGEVITNDQDQFKAGRKYAFLGFKALGNDEIVSLCLRSSDTGNLRIGQPIDYGAHYGEDLFYLDIAKKSGLPTIPVIVAENSDNTYVDLAANVASSLKNFYSYWAELNN